MGITINRIEKNHGIRNANLTQSKVNLHVTSITQPQSEDDKLKPQPPGANLTSLAKPAQARMRILCILSRLLPDSCSSFGEGGAAE